MVVVDINVGIHFFGNFNNIMEVAGHGLSEMATVHLILD